MDERITKAHDLLTRDELRDLTEASNWAGARAVVTTWAMIVGSLWLVAARPGPVTFVIAVIILGGRQLALGVLMHEAAHGSLFRTKWLNEGLTNWVCARPIGSDVLKYRKHHLGHHTRTGTDDDPDISLVAPFPVSRASLARKLLRDLSGVSGVRRLFAIVLMDLELLSYTVALDPKRLPYRGLSHHVTAGVRNAWGFVAFHLVLGLGFCLTGHAWAFVAWVVAYLTTYGLFLRIRSLAEHACAERVRDPMRNTRTTRANLLARLTVAPHNVAYHLEHHLAMTVPYFRLPRMHAMLVDRGALGDAAVVKGYGDVLRLVTTMDERAVGR